MNKIIRPTDIFKDNEIAMEVWNLIENTDQSLFLTGKAGTGKSTLISSILQETKKNYAIVAPTGIAAKNVDGKTINSLFQLPPTIVKPHSPEFESIVYNLSKLKFFNELKILIVDEVSMIHSYTIDCIDKILRRVRKSNKPFGGVQVIFVGDLYQLPPVVKGNTLEVLGGDWESEFFFDAKCLKEMPYKILELQKCYRQRDETFMFLLDAIRDKSITREELDLMNQIFEKNKGKPKENEIILTFNNIDAEETNRKNLSELPGAGKAYVGESAEIYDFSRYQAPRNLRLKEGAQVMFVKNNSSLRYYNGTIGIVKEMNTNSIVVTKEDGVDVEVTRDEWVEFEYGYDEETGKVTKKEIGLYVQFPLKLAWAVTVHKSQGLTFQNIHLNTGNGGFETGQVYTALSRCTSLEGVSLERPMFMSDIKVSERVKNFHSRRSLIR